jgi:hypothetical protein
VKLLLLGALVATFLAIAPSLGAADEGLPGAPADALLGAAEADASAGDLSYLLESTEPFVDAPPTGFTTEEYRTAVRNLVLADVARFSESERLKDLDRSEVRRIGLDQMGSDNLTRDTDARKAMNALWYSRTAPGEIPAPAPPPPTTTRFESSWSSNIIFINTFIVAVFGALAGVQRRNKSTATAGAIAGVVLLLILHTGYARGAQDPQAEANARARATAACESYRDSEYRNSTMSRRIDAHFIDVRRDNSIRFCQQSAEDNVKYNNVVRRNAWMFHGINSLIAIAVCAYFCRSQGVTVPERGICVAFLLAFIAQGLYEAHSIHTTNLAALRETERMGIEAATRTAAEERLTARWQYDRQLAVADLVFEACQTEAAAAPATKPD